MRAEPAAESGIFLWDFVTPDAVNFQHVRFGISWFQAR
jgi:hypothetical protein